MGEYVITTISIGGPIARARVPALTEAAQAYFADADAVIAAALAESTRATLQEPQNFGNTPDLDAFCRREGLSYQRAWISQIGVFEAGLEHWSPGMDAAVEEAADEGGDPMMTLAELRRCLRAGRSLSDVVARLSRAHLLAVPALTLARKPEGAGGG